MNSLLIGIFSAFLFANSCLCQKSSPSLQLLVPPPKKDSSLIWIVTIEENSTRPWTDKLDTALGHYRLLSKKVTDNFKPYTCDFGVTIPKDAFCIFEIHRDFDKCTREYGYSYLNSPGGPCIFLKLDKFPSGWMPQFYNSTDLPEDMPQNYKVAIKRQEMQRHHERVWVSCDGENPVDKENIGPLTYYPEQSFRGYYYVNRNAEGYQAPLVALYFQRPQRGIVINVLCKVWARNIPRGAETNLHFELLLDP